MEERDKVIKEINEVMENICELLNEDELEELKIELKKIYFGFKIAKEFVESEVNNND